MIHSAVVVRLTEIVPFLLGKKHLNVKWDISLFKDSVLCSILHNGRIVVTHPVDLIV